MPVCEWEAEKFLLEKPPKLDTHFINTSPSGVASKLGGIINIVINKPIFQVLKHLIDL